MTGRNSPSRRAWREGFQDFFSAGFWSAHLGVGSRSVTKLMNGADSGADLACQPVERALRIRTGERDGEAL